MATASSAPFTVQTVVVANHPPVWSPVPSFVFAQGIASSISVADYVTDADGDALTINMSAGSLPTGATYDAANKRVVYDGTGPIGSSAGNILTADDGKPRPGVDNGLV